MKHIILALASTICLFASSSASAQNVGYENSNSDTYRSLVFNKGDYDSKFYRIPAIVTLPDGTLIAVADRRINTLSDLPGDIDVVCRRSTDGGHTWSPYIMVAPHDSIGGYGDPALVYDRNTGHLLAISLHGQGLWQQRPGRIALSRSIDGGHTWLPPIEISNQFMVANDSINADSPLIKCNGAFASSGRALQLDNGRLMFVLVTRIAGQDGFPCYAIYSDDGGHTWKASDNPATGNGDESKVAQLPDGSLMMSIRNRFSGPRLFSVSTDRGQTWTPQPTDYAALHDVACNGDFLSISHQGTDYLIQSLPAGPWRDNITIYASADGGRTWPYSYEVSHSPGAYSAMTQLPDGSIGILTEEGVHDVNQWHHQGYRIWFTRVPLSNLLK